MSGLPVIETIASATGALALGLTAWQVGRDIAKQKSGERAQSLVASTLIGAVHATYLVDVKKIAAGVRLEVFNSSVINGMAEALRDYAAGRMIIGALLTLDLTALPAGAQSIVAEAQQQAVGLLNNLFAIARGERWEDLPNFLDRRIDRFKQLHADMRKFIPYVESEHR